MEKKKNTKRNRLIALGAICLVFVFVFSSCVGSAISGIAATDTYYEEVPEESFAILTIAGTIQASPDSPVDSYSYNHDNLMNYVDQLMEDETNHGILLKVNSGGGTVYHSDEFYLKLMEYKEVTGRPVHAYLNGLPLPVHITFPVPQTIFLPTATAGQVLSGLYFHTPT